MGATRGTDATDESGRAALGEQSPADEDGPR
jgi:hypothetical protein